MLDEDVGRGRPGRGAGRAIEAMEPFAKVCPQCGIRYDAAASFCQKDGAPLRLTDEQVDTRIGQVLLDQFRIEERIGVGGMGAVYRARQTTLGRDVAIKILHPDLASNPDAVRRFHREARISTALDHPNVVRVFLFGQLPDGSLYLVMELLRGRTLAELLRAEGALPVHRALHIATQVCDGVGEAHTQGIVHRDVKPENVFLVVKGRDTDFVKVLDFGIARLLRTDEQTMATQSGLVFGTARYISPEGAAGERTDARSDVYSLGVMTYQLLCGETPFDGTTPVTMLMKHIHDAAPHLQSRRGGRNVPDAVADVVMRALSKNPDARYEDAAELAEVLRAAAHRAGIDITRMRRDPSGAVQHLRDAATPSASGYAAGGKEAPRPMPRTVALPSEPAQSAAPPMAPPRSATLENAPSPFSGGTGEISIPGIGRRRRSGAGEGRSPWATVGIAFMIGAIAVASGAWAVHAINQRDPIALQAEELERRAEDALAQGRLDAPPEDSVLGLTTQLLSIRPADPEALRLRRAAFDRLVAQAERAEREEHPQDARALYDRALALVDDARAREARDRLASPPTEAPREAGIAISPDSPRAGDPVLLTATIANGIELTAADRPRFVITRARRRISGPVLAVPGQTAGTWLASFTFTGPGQHHIKFVSGSDENRYELAREIDVARPPRAPGGGGGGRDDDPPVTTQGAIEYVRPPVTVTHVQPTPGSEPVGHANPPPPEPTIIASPPPANPRPPPIQPLAPRPPQNEDDPPPLPPPAPWSQ